MGRGSGAGGRLACWLVGWLLSGLAGEAKAGLGERGKHFRAGQEGNKKVPWTISEIGQVASFSLPYSQFQS